MPKKTTDKSKEQWYSALAPEQLHKWTILLPWKKEDFSDAGVNFLGARVSSSRWLESDKTSYTKSAPLYLDTGGCIERGFRKTQTNFSCSYTIRASSISTFNDIMRELSLRDDVKTWDIKALDVVNKKTSDILKFEIFSPNGIHSSLYLGSVYMGGQMKSYKELLYTSLMSAVGDFYDWTAHCGFKMVLAKSCTTKGRVKANDIRLRKQA